MEILECPLYEECKEEECPQRQQSVYRKLYSEGGNVFRTGGQRQEDVPQ